MTWKPCVMIAPTVTLRVNARPMMLGRSAVYGAVVLGPGDLPSGPCTNEGGAPGKAESREEYMQLLLRRVAAWSHDADT
jgi:hypothetical protein